MTTIIMLTFFTWVETWPVMFREGHRLGMLQNTILTQIFGPKGEELPMRTAMSVLVFPLCPA
jgi:hypothetical protein